MSRSRFCRVAMLIAAAALVFAALVSYLPNGRTVKAATATVGERFGVAQSHLKLHSPARMDAELNAAQEAGISWVRFDFAWPDLEPSRGSWNFTLSDRAVDAVVGRGMKVLGILGASPTWANGGKPFNYPPTDMQAWSNYVSAVCSRYKGRVSAWEVWNEQNITGFWMPGPDPAAYLNLLAAASPAIRSADPAATVVMGGVAGLDPSYLDNCLKLGAAQYVDAIAYHPYPETLKMGDYTPQEANIRYIDQFVRNLISKYTTKPLQVWLTEFGWTTTTTRPPGVDEQTQASYLLRMLINQAGCSSDRIIYYDLFDDLTGASNPEANYGIIANDMRRKLSYSYYRTFLSVFGPATGAANDRVSASCARPNTLEKHCFNLPDGSLALALWKSDAAADTASVTISTPAGAPSAIDPATGAATMAAGFAPDASGRMTGTGIAVGGDPLLLTFPPGTAPPAPAITSVQPSSATVQTSVTVLGKGFGAARGTSAVRFGASPAVSYGSWSDTKIECVVPQLNPGMYKLSVTAAGGKSNETDFTVTAPPPAPVVPECGSGSSAGAISVCLGVFAAAAAGKVSRIRRRRHARPARGRNRPES